MMTETDELRTSRRDEKVLDGNLVHDLATIREMANPVRALDVDYLKRIRQWAQILIVDIDRKVGC